MLRRTLARALSSRPVLLLLLCLGITLGCRALFVQEESTDGTFSHKVHIEALGVACDKCHVSTKAGKEPGKFMSVTSVKVCAECHGDGKDKAAKLEAFLFPRQVGTFQHDDHASKSAAQCINCHPSVPRSTSARDRNVPTMESCWTCHATLTTMKGESGAKCSLCHLPVDYWDATKEKQAAFAEVIEKDVAPGDVPPEVMPPTHAKLLRGIWTGAIDKQMIPPDHSSFFIERSHGRVSMTPEAKCYACHFQRDCNECHMQTRPADHTLRFKGALHGRRANMRPESCQTCHTAEQCESCHQIPPGGHTLSFRTTGAHGRAAQRNARSCFTCHAFAEDCAQCHNR